VSKAFSFESKLLYYMFKDLVIKKADREYKVVVLLKKDGNVIVEIL
jgi:hypothetical protein